MARTFKDRKKVKSPTKDERKLTKTLKKIESKAKKLALKRAEETFVNEELEDIKFDPSL